MDICIIGSLELHFDSYSNIDYKIIEDGKQIGTIKYELLGDESVNIKEIKVLDGQFLPGLGSNLKSERLYKYNSESKLIEYNEVEFLDNNKRFTSEKVAVYEEQFVEIKAKQIEYLPSKENKSEYDIVLPANLSIYENEINHFSFFLPNEFSKIPTEKEKYKFSMNMSGEMIHLEFLGEEKLKTAIGEKQAYKLAALNPTTTMWIDQSNGILLKKIEEYHDHFKLTYEISAYKERLNEK